MTNDLIKFPIVVEDAYPRKFHQIILEEVNDLTELIKLFSLPIGEDGIYVDKWFKHIRAEFKYDVVEYQILIGEPHALLKYKEVHAKYIAYRDANITRPMVLSRYQFIVKNGVNIKKILEARTRSKSQRYPPLPQQLYYEIIIL